MPWAGEGHRFRRARGDRAPARSLAEASLAFFSSFLPLPYLKTFRVPGVYGGRRRTAVETPL